MRTTKTLTIGQIRRLSTDAHLAGDYAIAADCQTLYAEYSSDRCLDLADAIAAYPEQAARVVAAIARYRH